MSECVREREGERASLFSMLVCTRLQLEQERCDLLEELHSIRDKLSSAEAELEQKNSQLKQLLTDYNKHTKSLNERITKVSIFTS